MSATWPRRTSRIFLFCFLGRLSLLPGFTNLPTGPDRPRGRPTSCVSRRRVQPPLRYRSGPCPCRPGGSADERTRPSAPVEPHLPSKRNCRCPVQHSRRPSPTGAGRARETQLSNLAFQVSVWNARIGANQVDLPLGNRAHHASVQKAATGQPSTLVRTRESLRGKGQGSPHPTHRSSTTLSTELSQADPAAAAPPRSQKRRVFVHTCSRRISPTASRTHQSHLATNNQNRTTSFQRKTLKPRKRAPKSVCGMKNARVASIEVSPGLDFCGLLSAAKLNVPELLSESVSTFPTNSRAHRAGLAPTDTLDVWASTTWRLRHRHHHLAWEPPQGGSPSSSKKIRPPRLGCGVGSKALRPPVPRPLGMEHGRPAHDSRLTQNSGRHRCKVQLISSTETATCRRTAESQV